MKNFIFVADAIMLNYSHAPNKMNDSVYIITGKDMEDYIVIFLNLC